MMAASPVVLDVRGLRASYERAQVLFGIDLEVRRAEVVALLGRNGAGKSTTLKAIMGLVPETSGSVRLDDREVRGLEPFRIARLSLGYVPEERRIFSDLTVAENLEVGRRSGNGRAPVWHRDRVLTLFPELRELLQRRGGELSGGEQQMLTLARTLMGNPSLVMLDEPSEGLAPALVERLVVALGQLKRDGVSLLLSEQNLEFSEQLSDRVYVLERGQVRFAGSLAELEDNERIKAEYLAL
jgi:branched-chain amino acid transport system ATP-binding protein